jgi:hypothetical protein
MKILPGDNRTNPMLTLLIQSTIFIAGFCLGYAAYAWRSHRRRVRHLIYARDARPHTSMFGHARRAF